jgi:DNA-binding CsgD family transcriptional regulator
MELILCRRERLRERELVERLRTAYRLTGRQADVLRHLLRGASNAEIASALGVAYATVRRHLSDLQATLGAPNRVGVYRIAERLRDPIEFFNVPTDQFDHAVARRRDRK